SPPPVNVTTEILPQNSPIVSTPQVLNALLPEPPTISAVPSAPAAPLPPNLVAAPIITVIATPTTSLPPHTTPPTQTISAQVVGNEPTGEALIQTPIGLVRLQPDTMLSTGSQMTFQVTQVMPPSTSPPPSVVITPAPLTELAQHWISLQQIVT